MGFFILWTGFFAFNGVSEGGIVGDSSVDNVSRAVVNTSLSAAGGLLTSLMIRKLGFGHRELLLFGVKKVRIPTFLGSEWDICGSFNGSLTGMVSICAGAFGVEPWAAFVIGCIAGAIYCLLSNVLLFLHIDDPLDATIVHLCGGAWGTIAVALFLHPDRVDFFAKRWYTLCLGW